MYCEFSLLPAKHVCGKLTLGTQQHCDQHLSSKKQHLITLEDGCVLIMYWEDVQIKETIKESPYSITHLSIALKMNHSCSGRACRHVVCLGLLSTKYIIIH